MHSLFQLVLEYPEHFQRSELPCCLWGILNTSEIFMPLVGKPSPSPDEPDLPSHACRSRMTRQPFDAEALTSPPPSLFQHLTPVL